MPEPTKMRVKVFPIQGTEGLEATLQKWFAENPNFDFKQAVATHDAVIVFCEFPYGSNSR